MGQPVGPVLRFCSARLAHYAAHEKALLLYLGAKKFTEISLRTLCPPREGSLEHRKQLASGSPHAPTPRGDTREHPRSPQLAANLGMRHAPLNAFSQENNRHPSFAPEFVERKPCHQTSWTPPDGYNTWPLRRRRKGKLTNTLPYTTKHFRKKFLAYARHGRHHCHHGPSKIGARARRCWDIAGY